ncbi:hypothetical protein [Acidovorax sp.]|uniref:hypothetical protein n=1 Tax=Acidovorax sp. TaxID=1872122 RepID=UPI0025C5F472|nr:hypothetical protein [Acidovorax sp.]MBW8465494.1 hypothetical protein [Acidovorax sp.]
MSSAGLDNRAEEARLAAGTEQMQTQKRAAEELAGIKQKLSGVDKDYLPTLNKLFKQYQDGNIELGEYQRLVAKLAKDNFKTDSGASSALSDALDAKLQAYKNNDKAILDSRKAFYDAQALLVKLGGKSELDAIDESLAKEEEVWAQRKANFEAELAQAAKKKTSQAEVARITGQMQDAERDYEQNVAKLRADSAQADAKAAEALDLRVQGYQKSARAVTEQVRLATLEGQAIGLTGDALREFNAAQVEASATALERKARTEEGLDLSQRARDALLQEADAMRKLAKAQGENRAAQMVYEYAKGIEDSNKLLQAEIGLMGMSEQARTTALEQLRIQLDLEQKIAFVKANVADTDKQAADIAKLQASAAIAKANAANKAFLDEWKTSVGKYDDIFRQGFADMLNNGKDGWKSFTRSLATTFKTTVADQLYKAFAQPFVVKMVGSLMGVFGGSGGIGGAAGAAGGAGGLSNVASLGMNAYSAYSNFAGASGLGGLSSFAGGYSGAILPAGMVGPSIAQPTILSGLGNSVSGFTGGAGGAGAGSAIAGAGAFAAVAAVVLNALGAFKSERKNGGGLMGTLGSGQIDAWEEWRKGGTLFSGPSFNTFSPTKELDSQRAKLASLRESGQGSTEQAAALQTIIDNLEEQYGGLAEATAAQSKVIQSAFDAMRKSAGDMADTLGLSSEAARNFTTALGGEKGLALYGLKPEEQQAKLAEALATANNEIAQQLIGTWETITTEINRSVMENLGSTGEDASIVYRTVTESITTTRYVESEYAKDGEKAIDTLTRLASSLSAVNTIWDQLGNDMLQASLAGADAASRIAEAFGGLEAMSATTGSYFQNFYGADEQREAMRRQLQDQLGKLDLQLPDIDATNARAQYRALAEAQDRSTDAGLKAYVALLQLSGAFASITEAAKTTTQTLEQQRQAYYGALQDAVSARNKSLQNQLSAAQEVASALGDVFDTLRSNVRELYGEVDGTRGMLAAQGNSFIDQALATAKASGYLPDPEKLAEAISAARGGLDGGTYTTQFAADRDRLVLAGKLSGLQEIADKQLTDAQRTVRALETQIDQNEQTLDYWKQQIEIASGTYQGILSVESAIQQLSGFLGGTGSTRPTAATGSLGGDISGPAYRDRGTVARADYGADVALSSFEKFKDWYQGLATNANVGALQSAGYQVPDWMRVGGMAGDSTDKELFGSYLYFKNNPQFAKDFEQVMTTGRSSLPTDGSTLVRSDLSKMPADVAAYFQGDRNSLLSYESFGLDPVLAYKLYKDGPEQFGLNLSRENFTEWLRTHKWTEGGVVSANNTLDTAKGYAGYNLARYDTGTGNIVNLDGSIYSPDGKYLGMAGRDLMASVYGSAFLGTSGGSYGDATRSALYSSQVQGGATEADYYGAIKSNLDAAIAGGMSAQGIADAITQTGASLSDVAAAYGISVAQLEENLRAKGATNIPKFDIGTNYVPRDMLAYIHEGEAVVPKAYNPAAGGGGAGGNAELVAEVRALREQNATMAARLEAIEKNTQLMPQMGRQFDQYSNSGQFSRQKAIA